MYRNRSQSRGRLFASLVLLGLLVVLALIGQPLAQAATSWSPLAAPGVTVSKDDNLLTDTNSNGRVNPGDTLRYTINIENTSGSDLANLTFNDTPDTNTALVSGSTNISPLALDDSYNAIGNTLLAVGISAGSEPAVTNATNLFANDLQFDDAYSLSACNATAAAGGVCDTATTHGTVHIDASGNFTYRPTAGYRGATDSFTYTIVDVRGLSSVGTVNIALSGMVWYVKSTAGTNGDGRSGSPFNTLSAATVNDPARTGDVDQGGDIIYLFSGATNYANGLVLEDNQQLIGGGVALVVNSTTLIGAGSAPTIVNSNGNSITLALNNTLSGFIAGTGTNGAAILGNGFGALTVSSVVINSGGKALDLNNGSASSTGLSFTSITSTGGVNNVKLANLTGSNTFNLGSGALSGVSSNAFDVDNGTAPISYSGTISSTTARAVNVQNYDASGVIAFSGAISTSGSGTGINLLSNTGATINFTGGLNLSTTTANDLFTATGGGTVSATQNNSTIVNTLSSASGAALRVANTTIGGSGLTFRSISAGGGSNTNGNGIVLNTTGASGGLTVTGNGSASSGGTIQHKSGADNDFTSGIGIYLNSTQNPSFSWMQLNDFQNYGIYGATVTNLTLSRVVVNGNNGTTASGTGEGAVQFQGGTTGPGLTGTASISNSTFQGSYGDNFRVENGSGTLNRITFDTVTFNATGQGIASAGGNDLSIFGHTSAVINATVQNSLFTAAHDTGTAFQGSQSAVMDLIFTNNTVRNDISANPTAAIHQVSGSSNLRIQTGAPTSASRLTFSVTNNTFRDAAGAAIGVKKGGVGTGSISGTISGNTIGVSGQAKTGSFAGSGIVVDIVGGGSLKADILNNQIYQFANYGIQVVGGNTSDGGGQGQLQSVIQGNTVAQSNTVANSVNTGFPAEGLLINSGRISGPPSDNTIFCVTVGGAGALKNTVSGTGINGGYDLDLFEDFNTKINVAGYGGGATDDTAMQNFLAANNTLTTVIADHNANGYGSNCPFTLTSVAPSMANAAPAVAAASNTAANGSNLTDFLAAGMSNLVGAMFGTAPVAHAAELAAPTLTAAPAKSKPSNTDKPAGVQAAEAVGCTEATGISCTLGSLPTGKHITIVFDVTINNSNGFSSVSNQGTAAWTGNSALTDDPNVGGATDPTVTQVFVPDLTVAKSHTPAGDVSLPNGWTWTLHVANGGSEAASFSNGQVIASDTLPSGPTYTLGGGSNNGLGAANGVTGTIVCSISSNIFSCAASGVVSIAATTGAIDLLVNATPVATGAFSNGATNCSVDPNNVILESNEGNNACNTDSVTVRASDLTVTKSHSPSGDVTLPNGWAWTLHIANGGDGAANFANGQVIMSDVLPAGPTYTLGGGSNDGLGTASDITGTIVCSISSNTFSCAASSAVSIAAAGSIDLVVNAAPVATGTFNNGAANCSVDPNNVILESNEGNNACNADSVTVRAADLTVVKSHTPAGEVAFPNGWTWTLHLANGGDGAASFSNGQVIVTDALPAGPTYTLGGAGNDGLGTASDITGTIVCSISSNTFSCVASGAVSIAATTGAIDLLVNATPVAAGTFNNGATNCSVDPNNVILESNEGNNACNADSVTVRASDLTVTKSHSPSGTITLPASWSWTLHVANGGDGAASFTNGQVIMSDALPDGPTYTLGGAGNNGLGTASDVTGAIVCSISSNVFSCAASGAVSIAAAGSIDLVVNASSSLTGTFNNGAANCSVDPNAVVTESNEANNACNADTVVVSGPEPASWIDLVHVSASPAANGLLRDNSIASWSAGASSNRAINSGTGYIEARVISATANLIFGLGQGNDDQTADDIDFGILFNANSTVQVLENNRNRPIGSTVNYAANDLFRVAIEEPTSGTFVVNFYKNGTLFYSESLPTPVGLNLNYPLRFDTAFNTAGSGIKEAVIAGADLVNQTARVDTGPSASCVAVSWNTSPGYTTNVTVDSPPGSIKKSGTVLGWNAGTSSIQSYAIGSVPVAVEATINKGSDNVAFGLSKASSTPGQGDSNANYTDIDIGFYAYGATGILRAVNAGVLMRDVGSFKTGDVLRVEFSSSQVKFYNNNVPLLIARFTTGVNPYFPAQVDTSLNTLNSQLNDVKLCANGSSITSATDEIGVPVVMIGDQPPLQEVSFSDVHSGDYYYDAVQYLGSHGAVSGYSDGTFRPFAQVTRGQLAKMVVLAQGGQLSNPAVASFSDVPTNSPFYQYVETAVALRMVSGYSDGTFRPNATVTRGQLAKMVVLGVALPLVEDGSHFSDVTARNAFYSYIETAYQAGLISGYGDGTFKPNASATRGQIAKIIYNALAAGR